jgi:hypothetical protein
MTQSYIGTVDGQFHVGVILTPNVGKWSSSSCLLPGHDSWASTGNGSGGGGGNLHMVAKKNPIPAGN